MVGGAEVDVGSEIAGVSKNVVGALLSRLSLVIVGIVDFSANKRSTICESAPAINRKWTIRTCGEMLTVRA